VKKRKWERNRRRGKKKLCCEKTNQIKRKKEGRESGKIRK
jgi:hypothetical protein